MRLKNIYIYFFSIQFVNKQNRLLSVFFFFLLTQNFIGELKVPIKYLNWKQVICTKLF